MKRDIVVTYNYEISPAIQQRSYRKSLDYIKKDMFQCLQG